MYRTGYPYVTCYCTTDRMLCIQDDYGKLHFFERAMIEVVVDETNGRYSLIVVDALGGEVSKCFPLRNLGKDWERFTGYEVPVELKAFWGHK